VKNRPFHERLGFALAGWRSGWRRERSFRAQCGVAGAALLALILLHPAPLWWALVAVTVALVLALEMLNSAVEAVIDLLHPGIHPEIKVAKDVLAGAVLAISTAALLVAVALVVAQWPVIRGWFA
jgi:undecaprenol kinase